MNKYLFNLFKAIIALSLLDFIYLKSTGNIYSKLINKIQNTPLQLRFYSAIIVYILIFIMWVVFIYNNKDNYSLKENIGRAFLLGATTYGIYDFTNYAIFKNWTLPISIMDMIWGGILYSIVTIVAIY